MDNKSALATAQTDHDQPNVLWKVATVLTWATYIGSIFWVSHLAENYNFLHLPAKLASLIFVFSAGLASVIALSSLEILAAVIALSGRLKLAHFVCTVSATIHRLLIDTSIDYARQLCLLADINLMQGRSLEAEKLVRKSLKIIENSKLLRQKAAASSDPRKAVALALGKPSLILEPMAHEVLASIHVHNRNWNEAFNEAQIAVRGFEKMEGMEGSENTGSNPVQQGENIVEDKLVKILSKSSSSGHKQALAGSLMILGRAYNGLKQPAEAKAALKKSLYLRELCKSPPSYLAEVYVELAESCVLDDEPETAQNYFNRAMELARLHPGFQASEVLKRTLSIKQAP